MSAVLDALRRLQREREARSVPWQLGSSASDLVALGSARRRRPWRWLAGVGAISIAAGLGLLALRSPSFRPTALPDGPSALAPVASSPDAELAPEILLRSPLGAESWEPHAEAASLSAGAGGTDRVHAAPPVASPPPTPAGPARRATPATAHAVAPDAGRERAPAAPQREGAEFPRVRIDSIRWHPDPARRVAYLRVPGRPELEVHEGDIVAGMLVRRIDPDAVELGVGSARRRTRLGR